MRSRFGPQFRGVHSLLATLDEVLMKGVFDKRRRIFDAEEFGGIGLIVGEKKRRRLPLVGRLCRAIEAPEGCMFGQNYSFTGLRDAGLRPIALTGSAPGPGIAKPESRQQVES